MRQQQAPEGHVVGDLGGADRTQVNGVEAPQQIQSILGHHPAVLEVVLATPRELGQVELETAGRILGRREHGQAGFDHLAAGAITGDDRDAVRAEVAIGFDSQIGLLGTGGHRRRC